MLDLPYTDEQLEPASMMEAAEPPALEVEENDDGQFYADLLAKGIEHMAGTAAFGREAFDAIGGPTFAGTFIGKVSALKSTCAKATDIDEPVSLLRDVVETYLPAISPAELDAFVKAKRQDAAYDAKLQSLRGDMLMDELQFSAVDRECVIQALCTGYGVRLTLPAVGIMTLVANEDIDEGTPTTFVVNVCDGDYACDPLARNPREERFRACRLRVSSRLARQYGYMDDEQIKCCDKVEDDDSDDLIYIWFMCVYERTQIRFGMLYKPGDDKWLVPLTVWDAHPNGPIDVLALKPYRIRNRQVAPLALLGELHKAYGRTMQSLFKRGILEKRVYVGQDMPEDFQTKLQTAEHDAFINAAVPPQPTLLGGLTPSITAMQPILEKVIATSTANLRQSAGTEGGNDTARGMMILQSNAERILNDMKGACKKARDRVFSQVMYYDYYGHQEEQGLSVTVPVTTTYGTELMAVQVAPQDREADFFDLTFEISTNEARDMDPAVRLQLATQLGGTLAQMVAGIVQIGGNPDPLIRMLAEYSGMDELTEIFPTPAAQLVMQAQQQAAMETAEKGTEPGGKKQPSDGAPKPGSTMGAGVGGMMMTPISPMPTAGAGDGMGKLPAMAGGVA